MKHQLFTLPKTIVLISILGIVAISSLQARPDGKLAPAELVAKHLESIAPADARGKISSARIKGAFEVTVKEGGQGQSTGRVVLASQGNRNAVTMAFDSGEQPQAFAFDGNKTTVTQYSPGRHTPLEAFFHEHQEIVKDGLVTGTLSNSWPLLNLQEKNPKLEYIGLKKIDGREVHAVRYTPRKGSELKITLFFELETFRHVRTEYEQTVYASETRRIAGGGGGLPPATNARQSAQQLKAFEDYSDFKPEGGLTLPHTYKFELEVRSQTRPILLTLVFNLSEFSFNSPIEASEFSVGSGATKGN